LFLNYVPGKGGVASRLSEYLEVVCKDTFMWKNREGSIIAVSFLKTVIWSA